MNYSGLIVAVLGCLTFILADVTLLKQVQVIYENSPKLRIRGSGFDVADDHDITLILGAVNAPPLVVDKDYLVNLDEDGDGVILKLLTNRKWVDLANRSPPVALILSSVKFKGNNANLLVEPSIIAHVLATPTIIENTAELYQTASNELRINGTGFVRAKKVDLYFNPPLFKEVAYEDVSHYPLTKNEVVLRLRHGYKWSEAPGPLCVVGVDTGGGPVKVNGDDGVVVAIVEPDLDEHPVRVEDTADTQLIYNDEPTIYVRGSGFSEVGNLLRWANGLAGNNVNYTTQSRTESKIVLQLSPGSHWKNNFDNLPGALTLVAVNAGAGFVAVGPLNAGKGRDVATVFERPAVYTSQVEVVRTQSSQKLRVSGTGFPDLNSGFKPLLRFDPELVEGTDYSIVVIGRTELELTLVDGKAWRPSPGPLIVTHVNTRGDAAGWIGLAGSGVWVAVVLELASSSAPVAHPTAQPTIIESDDVIYQTASNELRINGTGFVGARKVDFYFYPPLFKQITYTDVTPYPLQENQVILRLRHGYQWRETPGPLMVVGVDTGGGPIKTNGDDGLIVAIVEPDLDQLRVRVVDTADTQLIYNDEPTIYVRGSGFSEVGNLLRWANGLAGNNVNYTTQSRSESAIKLRLTPGSHWIKNPENLPGTLMLLAINTGGGFVAVGPLNAGKGRDVATVFERPAVYTSQVELLRTQSQKLRVSGTGFPDLISGYKPLLRFDPELVEGTDYKIVVISRTELELTLVDGKAWRPSPGPLIVTHVNTRGDVAGWIDLAGSGVQVAEVVAMARPTAAPSLAPVADSTAHPTAQPTVAPVVAIFSTGAKIYRSALQHALDLTGTGFREGMTITFQPERNDYTLRVVNEHNAKLYFEAGANFVSSAGLVVAKSVRIGDTTYKLGGEDGIRIVEVLEDPVVTPSTTSYHASQSKFITIAGTGFSSVSATSITLRPTPRGAYSMFDMGDGLIRLQLRQAQSWLPASYSSIDGDAKIPVQVSIIDSGAGPVILNPPVTVGYIVPDLPGKRCDDTCEFAFDGVCNDGPENDHHNHDDDFGRKTPHARPCVLGTDCTDCGGVDAI